MWARSRLQAPWALSQWSTSAITTNAGHVPCGGFLWWCHELTPTKSLGFSSMNFCATYMHFFQTKAFYGTICVSFLRTMCLQDISDTFLFWNTYNFLLWTCHMTCHMTMSPDWRWNTNTMLDGYNWMIIKWCDGTTWKVVQWCHSGNGLMVPLVKWADGLTIPVITCVLMAMFYHVYILSRSSWQRPGLTSCPIEPNLISTAWIAQAYTKSYFPFLSFVLYLSLVRTSCCCYWVIPGYKPYPQVPLSFS